MKRVKLQLAAFCGLILLLAGSASAQATKPSLTDTSSSQAATLGFNSKKPEDISATNRCDAENLTRRIEKLESQNRALAQALSDIQAKLDAINRQEASAVLSTAAPAAQFPNNAAKPTAPPAQEDRNPPVRWSEVISEGNRVKLYGFIRLDLIDDTQRPNNPQAVFFITSPDPRAGSANSGDFNLHPRLTRVGIDFLGPRIGKLGDAKLTGKFETDFANGGTESQQIIRIRHAYFNFAWKDFSLLAGQTWDIVSPLIPTVSNQTILWNAGNVGDRRPQLRATYEPQVGGGKFSFAGGIGVTGAIDPLDLDANGVRDGEESARPSVQSRVGYSHTLGSKERVASIGVSSFYGFLKTVKPIAGGTEFNSQLVNADFTLPISDHISLKGEGWWGRNMSDIRGGIAQGINIATGRAIRGRGGWGEASFKFSRFSFHPGFSTDDPVDEDVPNGGRTRNRTFYLAHRITPGGNFIFGVDYLRWKTIYKGLQPGVDNRVNIFFQYNY